MTEDTTPVSVGPLETPDLEPMRQELIKLDTLPVITVSISSLLLDESPRQGGENDEHTRMLAESGKQLPPIVVQVPSMRVIDGIHRVRAAIMRGDKTVSAKEYHGTDDDAFALAVRMNIAHGLPLTRADRTAAAARIIRSHPQWSDRMIATTVGLSARTIAKTRHRSTAESTQSTTRLGQDGRMRPIDHTAGRQRVAALLADDPTSSNRAIAGQAGVSSSTVHEVRQRLRADQHPTPDHQAPTYRRQPSKTDAYPHHGTTHGQVSAGRRGAAILADLSKDPSLQTNDTTRSLLQCLDRYRIEISSANKIVQMVPPRWASSVAQLAREYVQIWSHIAAQLEQAAAQPRIHDDPSTAKPTSPAANQPPQNLT